MIRQLGQSIMIFLLLLMCGASMTAAAQSGSAYQLVDAVNQFRAQHGLSALQVDPSLMAAAQGHAAWMAANHHYSHTGAGGSTPQSRANAAGYAGTVYENIEGGTNLTAQSAVVWWQQDSIHLTTMLLPSHVHLGVGYAVDGDQNLFVLMVGKPSQAAPAGQHVTLVNRASPTGASVTISPIVVSTPREDGAIIHIVQPGQTAWAIAARYGIALAELAKLNNLKSGVVLHPGDSIIIRLGNGQTAPVTPTPPLTHVVQKGETLWTIAARSGIPLDDLLALNHLTRGAVLKPGDTVVLRRPDPTMTPTPIPTETPTISPTDTPEPTTVVLVASDTPTLSEQPSRTAAPALPTLTTTPGVDAQADPQPVLPVGTLVVAVGLLGCAAAGAILIVYRRR